MEIKGFEGEYRFLSNFWPCKIVWQNYEFKCSEALYMSFKSGNPAAFAEFAKLEASAAKKLGRQVPLREDWNKNKKRIMANVLNLKFRQNPDLKVKLLATGDAYLEETNWWKDTYWGVCNGVGENNLGLLLMELREAMQKEQ